MFVYSYKRFLYIVKISVNVSQDASCTTSDNTMVATLHCKIM